MLTELFIRFFNSERSGGIILIFCTVLSLVLTNLEIESYVAIWDVHLGTHTITQWINDGLMAIFFLLIGLELEREIYAGELSDLRSALLPVFAAAGGMLLPAGLYLLINLNGDKAGAGVPMATDIAFALGVLFMVGKRVPSSLKIFLTALAVIDDLGAIIIIAVFYTESINMEALGIAAGIFVVLLGLNRLRIHNLIPYLVGGAFMWYYMLSSGVHATVAGVLLAFAIPFGSGDERSPSYILQSVLHIPVAFVIVPLFALANTRILIDAEAVSSLGTSVSLGIMAGLLIGKPLGIVMFTYLASATKVSPIPPDLRWSYILGGGLLAGIGFTMSIFITMLAFRDPAMQDSVKLAVMAASVVAGIAGFVSLKISMRNVSFA